MSVVSSIEILDFACRRVSHDVRAPLVVAIAAISDLQEGVVLTAEDLSDARNSLENLAVLSSLLSDLSRGRLSGDEPEFSNEKSVLAVVVEQLAANNLAPISGNLTAGSGLVEQKALAESYRLLLKYLATLRAQYQIAAPIEVAYRVEQSPVAVDFSLAGVPANVLQHLERVDSSAYLADRDKSAQALMLLVAELIANDCGCQLKCEISAGVLKFLIVLT